MITRWQWMSYEVFISHCRYCCATALNKAKAGLSAGDDNVLTKPFMINGQTFEGHWHFDKHYIGIFASNVFAPFLPPNWSNCILTTITKYFINWEETNKPDSSEGDGTEIRGWCACNGKGIHPVHYLQYCPEEQNRGPHHVQKVFALQEGSSFSFSLGLWLLFLRQNTFCPLSEMISTIGASLKFAYRHIPVAFVVKSCLLCTRTWEMEYCTRVFCGENSNMQLLTPGSRQRCSKFLLCLYVQQQHSGSYVDQVRWSRPGQHLSANLL